MSRAPIDLLIEQIADAVIARLVSKDGVRKRVLNIEEAAEYLG